MSGVSTVEKSFFIRGLRFFASKKTGSSVPVYFRPLHARPSEPMMMLNARNSTVDQIMPTTDDLELPIKPLSISGPAVDELERRKEINDHAAITAEVLKKNLDKVRESLVTELQTIVDDDS